MAEWPNSTIHTNNRRRPRAMHRRPLRHGALLAVEMTPLYFEGGCFASMLGQERFLVAPSWKSWLVLHLWGQNLQLSVQASKNMLNKTEEMSGFDLVPR